MSQVTSQMISCPRCGRDNIMRARYCAGCGFKLPPRDTAQLAHLPGRARRRSRLWLLVGLTLLGAVLLAMLCSYHLGAKWRASAPKASETEGSEDKLNPDVLDMGSADGTGPTAGDRQGQPPAGVPIPTTVQRSGNLYYVVIESFRPEHLEHAQHAQRWLAQFGKVPATLETANRWHLLISAEGFEFTQGRERQWLDRVRALGQEYKQAFKGKRDILYDFHDPYARKW